jgi:hypothetical protein
VYTERVRGKKKNSRARRSLALASASLSGRGRGLSKKGSRQDGEREIARDIPVFLVVFLERVFITSPLFSIPQTEEGEEGGGDESKAERKIPAFLFCFFFSVRIARKATRGLCLNTPFWTKKIYYCSGRIRRRRRRRRRAGSRQLQRRRSRSRRKGGGRGSGDRR